MRACWHGLRTRWLLWRNRRLSDPAFQRAAARWPVARRFARRDTRALFELCAGFVYSQILRACVDLALFERLGNRPQNSQTLAGELGMPEPAMQRLLTAAVSLKLLERLPDQRYTLGPLGAAMQGNPAVAAMVSHHDRLYADLADPVALLRDRSQTQLAQYWGYAGQSSAERLSEDDTQAYTVLMSQSQQMIADQLMDAYDLSRHRHVLDVGGGDARLARLIAKAYPTLKIQVFDLPAVAAQAARQIAQAGLSDRIGVVGGNMFDSRWPMGADLITLVRILHDHDDSAALSLLSNARSALAPGGRLLIVEPLAGTPGAATVSDAYFGFYLWAMGQGRARSATEINDLLAEAGFQKTRCLKTSIPLLAGAIVAW